MKQPPIEEVQVTCIILCLYRYPIINHYINLRLALWTFKSIEVTVSVDILNVLTAFENSLAFMWQAPHPSLSALHIKVYVFDFTYHTGYAFSLSYCRMIEIHVELFFYICIHIDNLCSLEIPHYNADNFSLINKKKEKKLFPFCYRSNYNKNKPIKINIWRQNK